MAIEGGKSLLHSDSVQLYCISMFNELDEMVTAECEALSIPECDNIWIPKESFGCGSGLAVEMLVDQIFQGVTKSLVSPSFAGVEVWVQKYEAGRGLAFHFDKDEQALLESGAMKHPQLSSIVYLTGGRDTARQAPTVIVAQHYDTAAGAASPDSPEATVLCFPVRGQLCIFDGSLAHGVLESCDAQQIRMTLLINWWEERPQGIPLLSEVTGPMADTLAELVKSQPAAKKGLADKLLQHAGKPTRMSCQHVALNTSTPVTVQEACEEHGVSLRGPTAADLIQFQHPGLLLLPIEVVPGESDCAAAFVPHDSWHSDSADEM